MNNKVPENRVRGSGKRKRKRSEPENQNPEINRQGELDYHSVQYEVGTVQTEAALTLHLLQAYFDHVGLGHYYLSPHGWQEQLVGCSGRAQELAPLEQCFTSLFIALSAIVSPHPYLIGFDAPSPPWLSDTDIVRTNISVGVIRREACQVLARRAFAVLELHDVMNSNPNRTSLQLLEFAGAVFELVLPTELTLIQIVKRAAFRQLQAVSEGHVFVDPADFEFMTGPGLAETATNDSAFAAVNGLGCVATLLEVGPWYHQACTDMPPVPTFSSTMALQAMRRSFSTTLEECHNKIGAIFRRIVDNLIVCSPTDRFDHVTLRSSQLEIDKMLVFLEKLFINVYQYHFPDPTPPALSGSVRAAATFAAATDFVLHRAIQNRLDALENKKESNLIKLERDSSRRVVRSLKIFSKACGDFLKYIERRTVYLFQAFELLSKTLPQWSTIALTPEFTVQERLWLREGARIASWCSPFPGRELNNLDQMMKEGKLVSNGISTSLYRDDPTASSPSRTITPNQNPPRPPAQIEPQNVPLPQAILVGPYYTRSTAKYSTNQLRLSKELYHISDAAEDGEEQQQMVRLSQRMVDATLRELMNETG